MILVTTNNPFKLIARLDVAIKEGLIRDWSVDDVGDYSMTTEMWRYRAWFRHYIKGNEIRFGIIGSKSFSMNRTLYSVYHSRFVEILLTHFDSDIQTLVVSPLLEQGVDIV